MIAMNRYKWLCIKVGVRHGHAKGGDPWIPLLAQTRMPCTPHRIDRTCDPQQSVYHAQTQLLLSSPRCQPVDQSVHVGSAHTSDLVAEGLPAAATKSITADTFAMLAFTCVCHYHPLEVRHTPEAYTTLLSQFMQAHAQKLHMEPVPSAIPGVCRSTLRTQSPTHCRLRCQPSQRCPCLR